jgi:hypothetical protein
MALFLNLSSSLSLSLSIESSFVICTIGTSIVEKGSMFSFDFLDAVWKMVSDKSSQLHFN